MNRSASAVKSSPTQKRELRRIEQEVSLLRSFVISMIGEDNEGQYRPEFVKEMLKASQEKPQRLFKDADSFLAELQRV